MRKTDVENLRPPDKGLLQFSAVLFFKMEGLNYRTNFLDYIKQSPSPPPCALPPSSLLLVSSRLVSSLLFSSLLFSSLLFSSLLFSSLLFSSLLFSSLVVLMWSPFFSLSLLLLFSCGLLSSHCFFSIFVCSHLIYSCLFFFFSCLVSSLLYLFWFSFLLVTSLLFSLVTSLLITFLYLSHLFSSHLLSSVLSSSCLVWPFLVSSLLVSSPLFSSIFIFVLSVLFCSVPRYITLYQCFYIVLIFKKKYLHVITSVINFCNYVFVMTILWGTGMVMYMTMLMYLVL